jgi:reactive intermediate/imine deaminase
MKEIVQTKEAPEAIGPYSQAVKIDNTVYLSGQIPLDPTTMSLVDKTIEASTRQVFDNLQAVAKAAGGSLQDIVTLNVFLTNMANFPVINDVMADYFDQPYPARAAVGVASLPKGVAVEMDAIMVIDA